MAMLLWVTPVSQLDDVLYDVSEATEVHQHGSGVHAVWFGPWGQACEVGPCKLWRTPVPTGGQLLVEPGRASWL